MWTEAEIRAKAVEMGLAIAGLDVIEWAKFVACVIVKGASRGYSILALPEIIMDCWKNTLGKH